MPYSPEVEAIQKALNAVNIPVEVDGIFGDETEGGILLFQRSYTPTNQVHADYEIGKDDGVVAQKTVLALDEALMESWRYQDVDDVYITFADEKMALDDFAEEVYLSGDYKVTDHLYNTNPHLKYSFSYIMPGMPIMISPYSYKHPDQQQCQEQVQEMADEYLTLSTEEKEWFAKHHETATNAILSVATTDLDVQQGQEDSSDFNPIEFSHMLAGGGAVIAGAQVQGNKISKKMKSFAGYSKMIAAQTQGLRGQMLYSSDPYKEWRHSARTFQKDMKVIASEFGSPSYLKEIQAKKINNYLNVSKKQLYRAKDFSTAISGIEMTALYKEAMSFSKNLGRANGLVIAAGLYGNAKETVDVCNAKGWFEEQCGRSVTKNTVSAGVNVGVGFAIGWALAPVSGGLSIALVAGGTLLWGLYSEDISNAAGNIMEELIFD